MQELEERSFQAILQEKMEENRPENGSSERSKTKKSKEEILKRIKPNYLDRLDIPNKFKRKGFGDFEEDEFSNGPEVKQALLDFGADWEKHRDQGTWILLNGPYGVGKTHLAAATLRRCVLREAALDAKREAETGVPDRRGAEKAELYTMIGSNALVQEIKKNYDDNISAGQTLYRYKNARFLAIDDLGTERTSGHTQEVLHNLLNYRYEMEIPTLITTNYGMDELEKHITPRVMERVIEQTGGGDYVYYLQGDSYRRSG